MRRTKMTVSWSVSRVVQKRKSIARFLFIASSPTLIGIVLASYLIVGPSPISHETPSADAAVISYGAILSGPGESPANNSPGTGSTQVDVDLAAHTMKVQVAFAGLVAGTTASHIHACTTAPNAGTAGIATQT